MSGTFFRPIVGCALAALAGCATPAKQTSMVPQAVANVEVNKKFQSTITVASVSGGKATNPLWVSNISNEDFGASLTSALRSRGYYSANGPLRLDVTLLKVKQPLFGTDFTVTTVVSYVVKDAAGKPVLVKTITADYTAKFTDSLIGVERLRLANEGSARANIKQFLEVLGRG